MKNSSKNKNSLEKALDSKIEKNRVFARSISRQLNKIEENQVSGGGGSTKYECVDTYLGMGMYDIDCSLQ